MYVYAAVSRPRKWFTGEEHTKIAKVISYIVQPGPLDRAVLDL